MRVAPRIPPPPTHHTDAEDAPQAAATGAAAPGASGRATTAGDLARTSRNILLAISWKPSWVGMVVAILGFLYTLGSCIAFAGTKVSSDCADNETIKNCDEQLEIRIATIILVKLALIPKVAHYPLYFVDPNSLSVAADGYWGYWRPFLTRVAIATTVMALGAASVPFTYLFRMPVGVTFITLLCAGMALCTFALAVTDVIRGSITLGGTLAKIQAAGIAAALLGAALSYAAATTLAVLDLSAVVNGDSFMAFLLELGAQLPQWIASVVFWRVGGDIKHKPPGREDQDHGAGDGFLFTDVRQVAGYRPHLAGLVAGLDDVPMNCDLGETPIPGDHRSTDSDSGTGSDDEESQAAEAERVMQRKKATWIFRASTKHAVSTKQKREQRAADAKAAMERETAARERRAARRAAKAAAAAEARLRAEEKAREKQRRQQAARRAKAERAARLRAQAEAMHASMGPSSGLGSAAGEGGPGLGSADGAGGLDKLSRDGRLRLAPLEPGPGSAAGSP